MASLSVIFIHLYRSVRFMSSFTVVFSKKLTLIDLNDTSGKYKVTRFHCKAYSACVEVETD